MNTCSVIETEKSVTQNGQRQNVKKVKHLQMKFQRLFLVYRKANAQEITQTGTQK